MFNASLNSAVEIRTAQFSPVVISDVIFSSTGTDTSPNEINDPVMKLNFSQEQRNQTLTFRNERSDV